MHPNIQNIVKWRRNRPVLPIRSLQRVTTGDIVFVTFYIRKFIKTFSGICISVRKRTMLNLNSTFSVRNVLSRIIIEMFFAVYISRIRSLYFFDYQRKKFRYKRAKLYYLRKLSPRKSHVQV